MQATQRLILSALTVCLAVVACHPESKADARTRLAVVLRDSTSGMGEPNVSLLIDGGRRGSHLYVAFDTTAMPDLPDSVFARSSREFARFAVRHYEQAAELESVTVAMRVPMQPGAWRVMRSRAFAVAGLETPATSAASPPASSVLSDACAAFARIFTASASAHGMSGAEVAAPRDTMMSFSETPSDRPEPACRVAWRSPVSREAPLGDVLQRTAGAGWTQRDRLMSADGPDGSVLAFSRGDVACLVSGSWDGGDDSDSTYVPSPGFVIAANCFASRADRY